MEYWSWWLGGAALGLFAVLFSLLTGKPLGVSGSWLSIARRKDDAILKKSAEVMEGDQEQVKDDLLAMTMAEFGEDAMADNNPQRREGEANAITSDKSKPKQQFTPWTVHLVFLLSMLFGSYLAALSVGSFELSTQLSPMHAKIFEHLGEEWLALFFGGMMVGFGTQMAGGCTSGHGLSGTAQLVPASLLSTFVFMASASTLTLLMNALI